MLRLASCTFLATTLICFSTFSAEEKVPDFSIEKTEDLTKSTAEEKTEETESGVKEATNQAKEKVVEKITTNKPSKRRRRGISSDSNFHIRYGANQWNVDSTKIDTATILVRDKNTKKIVSINLDESAPDSNVFSGYFRVDWNDVEVIVPEVYIPPQNRGDDPQYIERVSKLLSDGKLRRKPFFVRSDSKNSDTKVFEVFDTREKAIKAKKAYVEQRRALKAPVAKIKPSDKDAAVAEAVFGAAKMAEEAAKAKALAAAAAAREIERVRLEEIERQKRLQRIAEQKKLKADEIARRKKQAKDFARQAVAKFKEGKFKEATELFEKAVDLDPSEKAYYLNYGISLYRIKEYEKSIVTLKNVEPNEKEATAVEFYLGMNAFAQEDYKAALDNLGAVRAKKDKSYSASAAFYEGIIRMKQKSYDPAMDSFQFVLDTSTDPKMDEAADKYISQILSLKKYAKLAETRFFFDASIGLTYDSNILLVSAETAALDTSSDQGGGRALVTAGAKYQPIFTEHHEFAVDLDWIYYYSFSDSFASGDPMLSTLSLPYTHKDVWGDTGVSLVVKPGYEVIHMDLDSSGDRETIQNTAFLETTGTFVVSPKWFTGFEFTTRFEDSQIAATDAADNADVTQFTLKSTNTYILNKKAGKILIGNLGYVLNPAKGDNNKYGKIDFSGSYIQPLPWDLSWVSTLSAYFSDYSKRSDGRQDTNFSLNQSFSRQLKEWLVGTLSLTYTNNGSNVESFSYNKFDIMMTFATDYSF